MTDRSLSLISRLLSEGKAFLLVTPPYSIDLDFVDPADLMAALEADGVTRPEFDQARDRATELLLGILSRGEDSVVRKLVAKGESESDIRRDLTRVRATLHSERLQRRYDLKRSSKAPSFSRVDWDVKIKLDDAHRTIDPSPYATLKIQFQREFGHDPFALLGGRTFDAVQLNLSSDEIDYLRKVLDRIRVSLEMRAQEYRKGG